MDSKYLSNFSKLSYEEKLHIIKSGKPTPELKRLQQLKGTKIKRKFQTAWYSKKEWLFGCAATNRLFCFPCLLFSESSISVWVKNGYCDLNNLPNALNTHERSAAHYENQISWKTFGSTRVDLHIDKNKRLPIQIHKEKVKKNRDILKKLISATCFLITQELAFRGDNEGKCSVNRGNYIELLKYTAKFDEKLAHHLQTASVFSGASNKIQNDLIKAVGTVVENNIKEEIARAPFIAIEMDEMADVSDNDQCATVLRYVLGSEIKEAFIGFDELKDRTASGVTECIFKNLDKYTCAEKLVAQTYDGSSVMASHLNGVQAKVREKAPSSLLTHCYAHSLNLVLSQSAKFIPECAAFFKTIEGLASFFSHSAKRTQFLDEIVQKRITQATQIRWGSNSKLVQTILHYHSDLCKLFNSINSSPLMWDSDTLVRSNGLYTWLTKDSTYFFLMVYDKIFTQTDNLCNILQTKIIDIPYCIERIAETTNSLQNLRKHFNDINEMFEECCLENNLTESNSSRKGSVKEEREQIFYLILNDILEQMEARYSDFRKLQFFSLVDSKKFIKLACTIDKDALETLEKNYGCFFDVIRLKTDLAGIYNAKVFRDKSIKDLLAFIFQNGLELTFPEAARLLQLVLTIPAATVSVERSFSALKRIKSFNINGMRNERLSSLALIFIEHQRLTKMEQSPTYNLYEKVTDLFATYKKRRMEFIYKSAKNTNQPSHGASKESDDESHDDISSGIEDPGVPGTSGVSDRELKGLSKSKHAQTPAESVRFKETLPEQWTFAGIPDLDELEALSAVVASKLRKMNGEQRRFAKNIIIDASFKASVNKLSLNSRIVT